MTVHVAFSFPVLTNIFVPLGAFFFFFFSLLYLLFGLLPPTTL